MDDEYADWFFVIPSDLLQIIEREKRIEIETPATATEAREMRIVNRRIDFLGDT